MNKILHKGWLPTDRIHTTNFNIPTNWYHSMSVYYCSIFKPILVPEKSDDIGHLINNNTLTDILIPDSLYSVYAFFRDLEHGDQVLIPSQKIPPFKVHMSGSSGRFMMICNLKHPEISLQREQILIDLSYYLQEIKPRYETKRTRHTMGRKISSTIV